MTKFININDGHGCIICIPTESIKEVFISESDEDLCEVQYEVGGKIKIFNAPADTLKMVVEALYAYSHER